MFGLRKRVAELEAAMDRLAPGLADVDVERWPITGSSVSFPQLQRREAELAAMLNARIDAWSEKVADALAKLREHETHVAKKFQEAMPYFLPAAIDDLDRRLRVVEKAIQQVEARLNEQHEPGVWKKLAEHERMLLEVIEAAVALEVSLIANKRDLCEHGAAIEAHTLQLKGARSEIAEVTLQSNVLADDLRLLLANLKKEVTTLPSVPAQPARRVVVDAKEHVKIKGLRQ